MWMEYLEDYAFTLHYHPGKANVVLDVLGQKSRGVLANVDSREWQMLEVVGQFGVYYSDQTQSILGSLVAMLSLLIICVCLRKNLYFLIYSRSNLQYQLMILFQLEIILMLELWLTIGMVAILLEWWLYYRNDGSLLEWWLYYWNGFYTIEIVAIIFLYKLISSSFVNIPSHTSYTSSNGRERGSRVKKERRSEREN